MRSVHVRRDVSFGQTDVVDRRVVSAAHVRRRASLARAANQAPNASCEVPSRDRVLAGTALALFLPSVEDIMKRSLSSILILAGGSLTSCGCGAGSESSPDTQATTVAPSASDGRGDACPLALPGTTFSIEDTVDGVVILFATPKQGDRAEVIRRAERLAAVHNQTKTEAAEDQAAAPPQGPGPVANEAGPDIRKLEATASVEPGQAEESVRLVLRPRDPAQLDANRDPLRKQADDLVQRVCDEAGRKNLH